MASEVSWQKVAEDLKVKRIIIIILFFQTKVKELELQLERQKSNFDYEKTGYRQLVEKWMHLAQENEQKVQVYIVETIIIISGNSELYARHTKNKWRKSLKR